jgi:DNA primase (bacterial type)
MNLGLVDVPFELKALDVEIVPISGNQAKVGCPAPEHKDSDPSCSIDLESGLWNCKACGAKGNILTFLSLSKGVSNKEILVNLGTRYELEERRPLRSNIGESPLPDWAIKALRDRGITEEIQLRGRLGFDTKKQRITIPVFNRFGNIVNVRYYRPGAASRHKMLNHPNRGEVRLYREKDLSYDTVWVCGGELKALVVGECLNESGVGAVAGTGGEDTFLLEWGQLFANKTVYICMDIDAPGRAAARKVADILVAHAAKVFVVKLPLDPQKFPSGDINDYVAEGGSLTALTTNHSTEYEIFSASDEPIPLEVLKVSLQEAVRSTSSRHLIEFPAHVKMIDTTPYALPKTAFVRCDRKSGNCALCPVKRVDPANQQDDILLDVNPMSRAVLGMVDAPDRFLPKLLHAALGIPECPKVKFKVQDRMDVQSILLAPSDTIANFDPVPALVVSNSKVHTHGTYTFKGRMYPHPRNQRATLLLDNFELAEDSLDTFDGGNLGELTLFRPKDWTLETLKSHLSSMYTDLSGSITQIYGREDMHVMFDLGVHSPLYLRRGSKKINGWTSILILGDSAQGKSEVAEQLVKHYGIGAIVDSKNMTSAGLLGGNVKVNDRWYVNWGALPENDRGMVVLEELKGCEVPTISSLTHVRSSGVAKVTKIQSGEAAARTRIIALSNPRSRRRIGNYPFGVQAIHDLIGSQEDVRRFDAALIVTQDQLKPSFLAQARTNAQTETNYPSELCKRLILWGWTRKEVRITDEIWSQCTLLATKLTDKFACEDMMLCDEGSMHIKLAKLSASLAIRTFSADEEGNVIIRPCHVDFISEFLDRLYSSKAFRYRDFKLKLSESNQPISEMDIHSAFRVSSISATGQRGLYQCLTLSQDFSLDLIGAYTGLEINDARKVVSSLLMAGALQALKRDFYIKTPAFINWLEANSLEGITETINDDEL